MKIIPSDRIKKVIYKNINFYKIVAMVTIKNGGKVKNLIFFAQQLTKEIWSKFLEIWGNDSQQIGLWYEREDFLIFWTWQPLCLVKLSGFKKVKNETLTIDKYLSAT